MLIPTEGHIVLKGEPVKMTKREIFEKSNQKPTEDIDLDEEVTVDFEFFVVSDISKKYRKGQQVWLKASAPFREAKIKGEEFVFAPLTDIVGYEK